MPEATSSWSTLYARMPIPEWVSSLSWVYSLLPDFNYWNWPEAYLGSSFVFMIHSVLFNSFTLWLQFSPVCWTDNRQMSISRRSLSFLEFQIYLSNCLLSCLKFILVQCLKLNSTYFDHIANVIFLAFAILLSIHGTSTFHDHYVILVTMMILISTHFSHSLLLSPSPCILMDNPTYSAFLDPILYIIAKSLSWKCNYKIFRKLGGFG